MPKDLNHIQEKTFALLKEVLALVKQQQTKLDQLEKSVQGMKNSPTLFSGASVSEGKRVDS